VYDYLILATGVRHSYFGHAEFEEFAPGLKSLADAVAIRNRNGWSVGKDNRTRWHSGDSMRTSA
jgi:NADH dehydrogenase FAD-containing subunit